MRCLAAFAGCIVLSSCVPFGSPPARFELGSIPWSGYSRTQAESGWDDASDADSSAVQAPMVLRGAVHPLQVFPTLEGRAIDVGVGYLLEGTNDRQGGVWRNGPYAELGVYPVRKNLGAGHRLRAGVRALGESFLRDDRGFDWGATSTATVELTGFADGAFSSSDAMGIAYGEWGFGLFAGPSVRFGEGRSSWMGAVGLSVRIPLTVGVVCCADLTDVAEVTEKRRSRASRQPHAGRRRARTERSRPKVRRKRRE